MILCRRTIQAILLAMVMATLTLLPAVQAAGLVVDHRHVELFEQIPDKYLAAARGLRLLFSDRSVGVNINDALNHLTASSWAQTPASARRDYYDTNWHWKTFTQADRNAGQVPARILFDPSPVKYDRTNWTFEIRSGSWSELTGDFINSLVPAYLESKDVLSYQFSYLNVAEGDNIADPQVGFFADNTRSFDIYDLERFMARHPDKIFLFWTTSLARGIGTRAATEFNRQMREYCRSRNKILFDVADILSHTPAGCPCYDNRDGVPYVSQTGQTENHPDDGVDYPAICQDYTTEVEGGHLGSVSAGGIRVAKAMWVLMARVAGWNPQPGALPAEWLRQYGLPEDGSADHEDPDQDGADNYREYVAGTNPIEGLSYFKVEAAISEASGLVLSWPSVPGRFYRVESNSHFQAENWSVLIADLPATPPRNSWTNSLAGSKSLFYRLAVKMAE